MDSPHEMARRGLRRLGHRDPLVRRTADARVAGGSIGQSRTLMLLLQKAHLGEVSVTVWPQRLKEICAAHNIHVLE